MKLWFIITIGCFILINFSGMFKHKNKNNVRSTLISKIMLFFNNINHFGNHCILIIHFNSSFYQAIYFKTIHNIFFYRIRYTIYYTLRYFLEMN